MNLLHAAANFGANKVAEQVEYPEVKELRLGVKDLLERSQIFAIAALVGSIALTFFFTLISLIIGGAIGAFFFVGGLVAGGIASVLCYDMMKASEKGAEIASHAKNFAMLNGSFYLGWKDQFFNQCQKLMEDAISDTLLLKHVYNSFLRDRMWSFIKNYNPKTHA